MISPDSPIVEKKDDKLGRTPFAKALAKAVMDFDGEDSFVVGINGKWGTGKSSVLNLIVEEFKLNSTDKQPIDILRFNPWNFSDQNQLVLQFMRQFTAHLRNLDKTGRANLRDNLVKNLEKYSASLGPPLEIIPYGKLFSAGLKITAKALRESQDADSLFSKISHELAEIKR